MRSVLRWFSVVAAALLVACNSVTQPVPQATVAALRYATTEVSGVAFLPPVGSDADTSAFFAGAEVRLSVHGASGEAIGATFEAAAEDGFYLGLWRVRDTIRATSNRTTTVQVRVWARNLQGSHVDDKNCLPGAAPDELEDWCLLGTFDAHIRKPPGRSDTSVIDVTKTQTLPIRVYIAGSGGSVPSSLGELNTLANGTPFTGTDNCPADAFSLPGQGLHGLGAGLHGLGAGLHGLGAVGGMIIHDSSAPGATGLIGLESVGAWLWQVPVDQRPLERNSVLLILDDFAGVYDLDDALDAILDELLDPAIITALEVDGDLGPLEAAFAQLRQQGQISHGALVMHHTLEALKHAGFEVAFTVEGFYVLRQEGAASDAPYLVVAAVNTGGFDTEVAFDSLQIALNAIQQLGWSHGLDARHVTVNMSFVIVPCSVLSDFDTSGLGSFTKYVEELGQANGIAADFLEDLLSLVLTPHDPDSDVFAGVGRTCTNFDYGYEGTARLMQDHGAITDLESWLALLDGWPYHDPWYCFGDASGIVYVASSGNFGSDFPLYPGAWDGILSVGSRTAADGSAFAFAATRSSFSNAAEVTAFGALIELGRIGEISLAYAGTSFASPTVAAFTAFDLGRNQPRCAEVVDESWRTFIEQSLLTDDDLLHSTWLNTADRWLPTKIGTACAP